MRKDYRTRVRWARKILDAKHFIVLTDSESIMALSGIDPSRIQDIEILYNQLAEIHSFRALLHELEEEHQSRLKTLTTEGKKDAHVTNRKQAKQGKV